MRNLIIGMLAALALAAVACGSGSVAPNAEQSATTASSATPAPFWAVAQGACAEYPGGTAGPFEGGTWPSEDECVAALATATPSPSPVPTATATLSPSPVPTATATPSPVATPQLLFRDGTGPTGVNKSVPIGRVEGGDYTCVVGWGGNYYRHGAHIFTFEIDGGDGVYAFKQRPNSPHGAESVRLDTIPSGRMLRIYVFAAESAEWNIACSNR